MSVASSVQWVFDLVAVCLSPHLHPTPSSTSIAYSQSLSALLVAVCCAQVASMMKGKTAEQIRKTFNIVNDFTPEEEAAIIAENKSARTHELKPAPTVLTRPHSTVCSHTSLCVAPACRWAEES